MNSVIPIWATAVATRARAGEITWPRRLVFIVTRRTVADQAATSVVETIRERLLKPSDSRWLGNSKTPTDMAEFLRKPSDAEEVLAVSTLRGELADNEEWKADPSQPAIIVGIDLIRSKILFSGTAMDLTGGLSTLG